MDVLKHLRRKDTAARPEPAPFQFAAGEAGELASVFAAPRWLRDVGRTSWLLVGFFALMAVLIWLLGTTNTIVGTGRGRHDRCDGGDAVRRCRSDVTCPAPRLPGSCSSGWPRSEPSCS